MNPLDFFTVAMALWLITAVVVVVRDWLALR